MSLWADDAGGVHHDHADAHESEGDEHQDTIVFKGDTRGLTGRWWFFLSEESQHHRTFKLASATSASMMETIQKRTTILGSCHPNFSK